MKRIFTPFAVICMLAGTQKTMAQTSCTTTDNFNATTTNAFTQNAEQFTGDFDWTPTGNLGAVEGNRSLISPAFSLFATQSTLYWGFDLDINSNKVKSWTATLILANNSSVSQQVCSGGVLNKGTQKFKVAIPDAFKGQPIKIRMDFVLEGSANKYAIIDNFQTNTVAAITLPVNFTGLQARKSGAGTQVTWNVAQEDGVISYAVEKSTDGINYAKIGTVAATGSSSYSFADNQASSGTAFYRVKSIDKDGQYRYSTIVKLDGSKVSFIRNAYPMPATTEVNIQHNAAPAGTIMTLTSQDGRLVQRLQVQNGSMQTRIDLSSLKPGMYLVRFDNDTNNTEPLKIIKQ